MQLFGKIAFFITFVYYRNMLQFKILSFICILICSLFYKHANTYAWWWPGESFNFGFYSSIHKSIDKNIDTLRKKELKRYSTFAGFGSHCRAKNPAIDNARMDENLLIEVSYGNTSRLLSLIQRNRGVIDSDSLLSLSLCLAETYRKIWDQARIDENNLSEIWAIGLYTDGDTSNSDYDIIADIEKINSIIFTEKLDYNGVANMAKSSFVGLWQWYVIPNILSWMTGVTLSGGIVVGSNSSTTGTTPINTGTDITPSSLGIWAVCSTSTDTSVWTKISVNNMVDDDFLVDISSVLGGYNPGQQNTRSHNYGNTFLSSQKVITSWSSNSADFFHSPPCTDGFCIKIKTIGWSKGALAWWKTYTIESLIEKHSKIMEPIANSNLSAQKHQKNSFQLPFLNIKFKNQISWAQVYIENSPQLQKKYKEEYTQSTQDQEFDSLQRCAYVSAWLPWDKDRANIPAWVWYQFLTTTDSTNTTWTKKTLWTINPDDSSIASNCMEIALAKPKEDYYLWLSTDTTELEVFTSALISQISRALQIDTKLDTLQSK